MVLLRYVRAASEGYSERDDWRWFKIRIYLLDKRSRSKSCRIE